MIHQLVYFFRYNVISMNKKFIHARLATGPYMNKAKDEIFIPRIKFMPDDAKCPVEFQRIQFPIRGDFGITCNKSQGKTYKHAGINLTTDCFAHGQLYVSMSRTGSGQRLKIFKPKTSPTFGYMRNVVYPEVLSSERIHVYPENDVCENDDVMADEQQEHQNEPLRLSYNQQKIQLAPGRLQDSGFKSSKDTPADGNCFIHALKDQMR